MFEHETQTGQGGGRRGPPPPPVQTTRQPVKAVQSLLLPPSFCVFLSINHTLAALIAVHGVWDEWSPWSLCSSTCGRGHRERTRSCKPPQFGGDPCPGPDKQNKFCNIAVCPGEERDFRANFFCENFCEHDLVFLHATA